jgi:membrane-bound lytic murein transglycosylase D
MKIIKIIIVMLLLIGYFGGCSQQQKPVTAPAPESGETLKKGKDKMAEGKSQNNLDSGNAENDRLVPDEGDSSAGESKPVKKKPAEILEEALDAYGDAQAAWDKADIDTALAALDEAYGLIIKLDLGPDSPLLQEKNDLRLLIAQRIQEIYASHLIAVGENHRAIPLTENEYVNAEIKRFQTVERQYFLDAYQRSGLYRQMILEKLQKAGLPEELCWIPVIESGFKVKAYSRARALGLWQFISSTAYRFGLKRDRWIDERMDPEKSTKAAVQYLNELHAMFGDWTTALAAYNCGEFGVQRVIQAQRINYLDNFWDLFVMLPRETARFVPRFIATLLIIKNPETYGFTLPEPEVPVQIETVAVRKPIKLSSLSRFLKLEENSLEFLNPELRHQSTPDSEYPLKIPAGYRDRVQTAIDSLSRWIPPEATTSIHYVRRGETVSGIARRYRTSVSAIARLNHLRRNFLIRPGQKLRVPSRYSPARETGSRNLKLIRDKEKQVYVVEQGDSLYQIAHSFNTSVDRIKKLNQLENNVLSVGQKLIIQPLKVEGSMLYTVQAGDTPYTIASHFGMSLAELLRLNGLHKRSRIYPGQQLWVIPDKEKIPEN